MITKYINKIGLTFVLGSLIFYSCEDRITEEFTRYEPKKIEATDGSLIYTAYETYPIIDKFNTPEPTVTVEGAFIFSLEEITVSNGGSMLESKLTIDKSTGALTYDNKGGTLVPGTFKIDIGLANAVGLAIFDDALTFTVLELPITLSVDNPAVNAGALQQSVVATVSYTDTSTDGLITSLAYSLTPAVEGFAIDEATGEISKTGSAAEGDNAISLTVTTNLGIRKFDNVVTVTVGAPPTIAYTQQDGTTSLTKVTVSPWTAYTTLAPTLDGMAAVSYTVDLPASLSGFEGFITAAADGSVSIAAGATLPLGEHIIGVTATNSGDISQPFADLFTLTVETRWEANAVFFEDFNLTTTSAVDVNTYNAALSSYNVSTGGSEVFNAITSENIAKDRLFQSAKMRDGKNTVRVQAVLLLSVTIDPSWYNMRVSFNELFGFSDSRLEWWERNLSFGYDDTEVAAGTYNAANWNILMDAVHTDWSTSSGTVNGARDTDMTNIPAKDFGSLDNTQPTVFINWYIGETSAADGVEQKGSEFHVDDIKVEVSKAFAAEEE